MVFAVYCHAVMTMIFFSEFPFDNVCLKTHKLGESAPTLDFRVYREAQEMYNVTTDLIHERCDQTITGRLLGMFAGGSVMRDNMYGKQAKVVQMYVYLVLGLTAILFIAGFGAGMVMGCWHLFKGAYKSEGDANSQHFTTCDILAYIPFIRHSNLAFPLIVCDVRSFEPKYLAFDLSEIESKLGVEEGSLYSAQSLMNKAELPGYSEEEMAQLFSEIKYYPPPEGLVELPDSDIKVPQEEEA